MGSVNKMTSKHYNIKLNFIHDTIFNTTHCALLDRNSNLFMQAEATLSTL